jgi:hypothetical protein
MTDINGPPKGVTLHTLPDGTTNPKYVDLLDEDKPIAGQKFACLSFISPEHIIKQREHFFFQQFVEHWDIHKSTEKFLQFLSFVSYKYGVKFDKLTEDFQQFKESEKELIAKTDILDDYKTFLDLNEERLDEEFAASFPRKKKPSCAAKCCAKWTRTTMCLWARWGFGSPFTRRRTRPGAWSTWRTRSTSS